MGSPSEHNRAWEDARFEIEQPIEAELLEPGAPLRAKRRGWKLGLGLGCGVPLAMLLICGGVFGWVLWKTKSAVDPVAEEFLSKLDRQDYAGAYPLLASQWQAQDSLERFTAFESRIREITGTLQSKRVQGVFFRSTPAGRHAVLTYAATFTKGQGQIVLSFLQEGGQWRVLGHTVNSPLFLQALKCPHCGFTNKTLGRFCASCGKEMK